MEKNLDLLVRGGIAATPNGIAPCDIGALNGRIVALGRVTLPAAETIDATGLHVLPGVIDTQVHFREPGLEHKEDLDTGTRAAAMGGVTAVFEMPNTTPPTTNAAAIADKVERATGRAWCDFAFFAGASEENAGELAMLERTPGCCGVKIFMGSSTGSLLVADDDALESVLRSGTRRCAIHAEDEPRLRERLALVREGADVSMHPVWRDEETALKATRRIVALARKAGRRIHVLHVTTAEEMAFLAAHKDLVTVETTPQHLTLAAPDCYERLGTFAQMNPPIRDARHREALWRAVSDGVVDVIGSDHAPHTREEKAKPYPQSPSGMPGVQTLVPLLLDHIAQGRLTLERFVDLTSASAARIYNIAGKGRIALGYDADLTLVDLKATWTIENDWIASRCGWTPFAGMKVTGRPISTIVRGMSVMRDRALVDKPRGRAIRFTETMARGG